MSEWQTMDTAPRDGTVIDVWARDRRGSERRITDVHWGTMTDWTGVEFEGWSGMYPRYWSDRHEPLHWMPVPTPPHPDEIELRKAG